MIPPLMVGDAPEYTTVFGVLVVQLSVVIEIAVVVVPPRVSRLLVP